MSDFMADADTLDDQGLLHFNIAQFYRKLVDQVQAHGQQIVSEFQRVGNDEYAGEYQRWLNHPHFGQLHEIADLHANWSQYFFDLAAQIRAAENALSGNSSPDNGGGQRPGVQ
jgi:hypothetical protein